MKFTTRIILFGVLVMIMLAAYAEAARVRVAIPSTTHAVLAFTTTRDKGYYREEGLDVELILMSAPIASRALLGGDVEVATMGGAGLPPVLSGAPLRFVFTTTAGPCSGSSEKRRSAASRS
jgi:ABC-type nitrate/sulfonate/bicarbonate transport system substrate-binding protein